MELIWHLQQTTEDYIMHLETRHLQQDLVLEKQGHSQATREQEAILIHSAQSLTLWATNTWSSNCSPPPPPFSGL
ncbi:hypothetical protein QTO34_013997 [Cnephaeus nilssonii]|uniref:Uncharacterized protein n=1 Tax=Cnephaeus nilssonii TaxID=3371016 RepID=A0AA40LT50_CNENI|nr:hypothetical protein QTO34_013997 [Eptesicus nilssonii]